MFTLSPSLYPSFCPSCGLTFADLLECLLIVKWGKEKLFLKTTKEPSFEAIAYNLLSQLQMESYHQPQGIRKILFSLYHLLVDFSLIIQNGAALFRLDQISLSVVSDSLRPHESQHARPPCPSPTRGVHSDSRPSSQ